MIITISTSCDQKTLKSESNDCLNRMKDKNLLTIKLIE